MIAGPNLDLSLHDDEIQGSTFPNSLHNIKLKMEALWKVPPSYRYTYSNL